jgi:hypothetical protein
MPVDVVMPVDVSVIMPVDVVVTDRPQARVAVMAMNTPGAKMTSGRRAMSSAAGHHAGRCGLLLWR